MSVWISLLRGVNVLGSGKVSMAALAAGLEGESLRSVKTYIQSGNVVLESPHPSAWVSAEIADTVARLFGFRPMVTSLSVDEVAEAIRANPFEPAGGDHRCLHLYFLAETATAPRLDDLTKCAQGAEEFALINRVFYLHTPNGFANSRVASRVERCLGVAATARNFRTANRLLQMAQEAEISSSVSSAD